MRFAATFFISILGLASALPLESVLVDVLKYRDVSGRNTVLEQFLLDLIEDLKEIMLTGTDSIPILDPLQISQLDLDLGSLGLGEESSLSVRDAVVSQLSTFEIDHLFFALTSGLSTYTLHINGHINRLLVKAANYGLNITMLGFTIFGNGEAEIEIINPELKIDLTIITRLRILPPGLFARVDRGEIRFDLEAFKPKLTGMFDNDITNDFINSFLSYLVPELVEFYEDEISRTVSLVVIDLANELLEDLNLLGLVPFELSDLELQAALE